MAWLSHTTVPSSSMTGTRRLGFIVANSSVSRPPNGPPASMCSCARPSSPAAHMTFCTLMEFRRPQMRSMSAPLQRATLAEEQGLAVVDQFAVDAHPTDLAGHAAIFDLGAAVHDHSEPRLAREFRGFLIDYAELHPDRFQLKPVLFRQRLAHDAGRRIGGAKNIDRVDGSGHILERRIDRLAEDLLARESGIDGPDEKALVEQIFHREIARPHVVTARAHHRDGFGRAENGSDQV